MSVVPNLIRKILQIADVPDEIASASKMNAGPLNVVYRVTFTSRRPNVIVRIRARTNLRLDQEFAAEHAAYPLLQGLQISVPSLQYFCPDPTRIGFPFAVFECIEGRQFDQMLADPAVSRRDRRSLAETLADTLGELHRVKGPSCGLVTRVTHGGCQALDYLETLLHHEELALRAYDPYLASLFRQAVREWLKTTAALSLDQRQPSLIHGDLHGKNIIVDQSRTMYLLDWEASAFSIGASDLAQFLYMNLRHDPKTTRLVVCRYAEVVSRKITVKELWQQIDMWTCIWQCRLGIFQTQFPKYQDDYFGRASDHFPNAARLLTQRRTLTTM